MTGRLNPMPAPRTRGHVAASPDKSQPRSRTPSVAPWASQACSMAPRQSPGVSNGAPPSRSSLQVCVPLRPLPLLISSPVVGVGSCPVLPSDSSDPSPGITTDLLVYSIIIPVMPFQLEHLKYLRVSALTGWLLCAYVRPPPPVPRSLAQPPTVRRTGPVYVSHPLLPPILISCQPQYPSQSSQRGTPPAAAPSSLVSSLSWALKSSLWRHPTTPSWLLHASSKELVRPWFGS